MPTFRVAGVNYENRNQLVQKYCKTGMKVRLVCEPENKHDTDALAVYLVVKSWIFRNESIHKIGYHPQNTRKSKLVKHLNDGGNVSTVVGYIREFDSGKVKVSIDFEYV